VLFGSSVYSGRPLRQLVDESEITPEMMSRTAAEHRKGRRLYDGTTNLDTRRLVVWDLGAIAKNGGSAARTLFRDVLVASASVPGMFPPVIIRVAKDGLHDDQAHVDGATTAPFFVPPALLQKARGVPAKGRAAVFVIVDGSLSEGARTTRLTARAILSRSIRVGLNHLLLTTLQLTAATAQLEVRTCSIRRYRPTILFRMRLILAPDQGPLFHYAYQCAESGRLWTVLSPLTMIKQRLMIRRTGKRSRAPRIIR
jgi:predicted acylesterase/phospholipase RssA